MTFYQQASVDVIFDDDSFQYKFEPEIQNPVHTQLRRVDPLYFDQKSTIRDLEPIIQGSLSLCANLQKVIAEGLAFLRNPPNKNQLAKNLTAPDSTVWLSHRWLSHRIFPRRPICPADLR